MNYANPNPYRNAYTPVQSAENQSSLIQRVSYLLSTALLTTAGGAYISEGWSGALGLPLAIGTLVCVFGINFARRNVTLSLLLLYGLSLMEGLMMGPLLSAIARGYPYGGMIIAEATGLSAIIIAGVGSYVWISSKDFNSLGKYLMIGLIGVILISVIAFFWHSLAAMAGFQLGIALFTVALFVGFALYDFSNIKFRYTPDDYVIATVQLYLDFLNLFWALLRILMIFAGGGSSRRS